MAVTPLKRPDGVFSSPTPKRDLTREYVAVQGYTPRQATTLASTYDDVEIELDADYYDRMGNDSAITKCKRIIITNALTDEIELSPLVTEDNVPEDVYDIHHLITGFCDRILKGLNTPIRPTCEQMLDNAISYGHAVSEIVWELREDGADPELGTDETTETGKAAPSNFFSSLFRSKVEAPVPTKVKRPDQLNTALRLMPKYIKVKPRGTLRFVVDPYMNVLGLVPKDRLQSGLRYDEILEREKFMVLSLNKKDEDPRGKSLLRPAVNWYNIKSQFPAEILRFILEESVPKAVATLGPNASPYEYQRDPDTNEVIYDENNQPKMWTAVESMAKAIEHFRGGSGAVIPYEAKLEPFKKGINTDANLFPIMMRIINNEIENCILLQTLAQSEGEHQARSASQQVAEILYNLNFWVKYSLAQMIRNDLFVPAVKANFGDWAVSYIPFISFGDFVRRDWVSELEAISDGYFKGFIDDSQRRELAAWMGLPRPGQSRQELMQEAVSQPDINGEPQPNPSQRPDKQGGDRTKGNGTEKGSRRNQKKKRTKNGRSTRHGSPTNILGDNARWFGRS